MSISSSKVIILPSNNERELLILLAHLVYQIQKEFDISDNLLSQLINHVEFLDDCHMLYQQCHAKMLITLNGFKQKYAQLTQNVKLQEVFPEKELCGHLIKIHHNGYHNYCNVHKYLHDQIIDHQFVEKNQDQIFKEKYHTAIHQIYQSYVNQLYVFIRRVFDFLLQENCHQSTIILNEITIDSLVHEMQGNSTIFKSKNIYRYLMNSNSPIYYLKIYHIKQ